MKQKDEKKKSKTTDNTNKCEKYRVWSFIIYPFEKDTPDNWKLMLTERGRFRGCISPLHSKDIYTEEDLKDSTAKEKHKVGDLKKPHYHVLLSYESNRSSSFIEKITKEFNSPRPIHVDNNYVRYFVHLDQKNKHQYSIDEIEAFGGFDFKKYMSIDKDKDDQDTLREILKFVGQNHIGQYNVFIEYVTKRNNDWLSFLLKHSVANTMVINTISSERYSKNRFANRMIYFKDVKAVIDVQTGQIMEKMKIKDAKKCDFEIYLNLEDYHRNSEDYKHSLIIQDFEEQQRLEYQKNEEKALARDENKVKALNKIVNNKLKIVK